MKGGGGLAVLLGGEPMGEGEDLDDDYAEDLAAPMGDEGGGNPAFDMYAEEALGTNDPAKLSALREAIRSVLEEQAPVEVDIEAEPMGGMGGMGEV